MGDDSLRFLIACEDEGHFRVTSALIDARAIAGHNWLDGVLDSVRVWQAEPGSLDRPYVKCGRDEARWSEPVVRLEDGTAIRLQGHIAGQPSLPEANMWRKVLAYAVMQRPRPSAVVLVRDLDGYPDRRAGIEQARDRRNLPWPADMPIVVATPQPEIEAWLVSGFSPEDDEEHERLSDLRRELSFDPTVESHRLTSHPNTAAADAKRVLAALTRGAREREVRCLADGERLADRGSHNYCREFMMEIDQRIVPIFEPPRRAR